MLRQPSVALQVAEIAADNAQEEAPALVPRATYAQAQAHAIAGRFPAALERIAQARAGYEATGDALAALRTDMGRMDCLNNLGRSAEAIEVGSEVFRLLDAQPESREQRVLRAITYQNLGIALGFGGRYAEALGAHLAAEQHHRALGLPERAAMAMQNRGIELLNLGRAVEALAVLSEVVRFCEAEGPPLLHARCLIDAARAHLALGSYQECVQACERARDLLEGSDAGADAAMIPLQLGDAHLTLNLFEDALGSYRDAATALRAMRLTPYLAAALWGAGSALVGLGRMDEAEAALNEAARLYAEAGNEAQLAATLLERAAVRTRQGRRSEAVADARRALASAEGASADVQRVYAHLRLADLLAEDVAAVELHLREAGAIAGTLALPRLRYRLDQRLGRLRLAQGRRAEAQALLESAVAQIEELRGRLLHEAVRASFLQDKVAAYADLLRLHLSRGDEEGLEAAFAVAEQVKSRALVDLLIGVRQRRTDTPAEDRRRELQADLNAVHNELLGGAAGESPGLRRLRLQERAGELERGLAQQRRAAGASAADWGAQARSATHRVRDGLPPDLVLVAYHVLGDEVLAFVSLPDRLEVVRRVTSVAVVQQLLARLSAQWDRFRSGAGFVERHQERLEASTRRVLGELYGQLWAPLSDAVLAGRGQERPAQVAVVPHGPLHAVPFHALHDGAHYLLESYALSSAPSAQVLRVCLTRRATPRGFPVVLGAPDALIPEIGREVRAVASALPGAVVRLDDAATVAALRELAPGATVVHLACHGLYRPDNAMFSALKLSDGWLLAADALQLELDGALVTLSACESGRSAVVSGGDEVLGLTRAFLGAGAGAVLVSLWLVHDESTATLMADWYRGMAGGLDAAAALRAAQLALMRRHPHPFYWAPFTLVGRRASAQQPGVRPATTRTAA